jgi:hypothetical protein
MTWVIIAMSFCAVSSIILFDVSDKFQIDAAPVEGMLLAASVLLAVAAVFLGGMFTGMLVGL